MDRKVEELLTKAERQAAHAAQDYLLAHGGDSTVNSSVSPCGDGRWVPLLEIFGRTPRANAARQAIRRLHRRGELRRFEIAYYGDCLKAVPMERVAEVGLCAPKTRRSAVSNLVSVERVGMRSILARVTTSSSDG